MRAEFGQPLSLLSRLADFAAASPAAMTDNPNVNVQRVGGQRA